MNSKILVPLFALIICLVLALAGGAFIFGQIGPMQGQIAQLNADTVLLTEKQNTLENVRNFVTSSADITRLAIPSNNSTAPALAQIKRIAQEEGITLSNINATSTPNADGSNMVRFAMKANGSFAQMQAFFSRLKNLLPIINIEDLAAEDEGGGTVAFTTTLNSFWSPLPQTLPEITGTLSSLSEDEVNILSQLSEFELPAFEELAPESTSSGRLDPFIFQ